MSRMHRLKAIQLIPASLDECWSFFSDARNLQKITPASLNLKITNQVGGEEVYPGQILTYRVKPLFNIPLNWTTEITHVEPLKIFVDEQKKGPYRLWRHEHYFKAIDGGVEMTDIVTYRIPFSVLGELAHVPLVKPKLREIFDYRWQQVEAIFGKWPGARKFLQID